ncbi:MAG: transglutaminase domain-containing protein [Treponema sp.]
MAAKNRLGIVYFILYYIRKYPAVRLNLLLCISAAVLGGLVFFSSSTITVNTIESIEPQLASPGEIITLTGTHFGNKLPYSWLMVGQHRLKPEQCLSWTDTEIVFEAPASLHEDIVYAVVKNKQGNAALLVNKAMLPVAVHGDEKENAPVIERISAAEGAVGELITIHGTHFGKVRNTSTVLFTGSSSPIFSPEDTASLAAASECSEADFDYEAWSDRELKIRVPDAAASGSIVVITDTGVSNLIPFTVRNKHGRKKYTETRTYRLTSEIEVSDFYADNPNTFFLRVPVPQKTAAQRRVMISEVVPQPFILHYQGSTLHRFSDVQTGQRLHIKQEYTVKCSAVETELTASAFRAAVRPLNPLLYAAYTEAHPLIPADSPTIKKLCKTIVKNEQNPYHKALRIYRFLTQDFKIHLYSGSDAGRSIITAAEEKNGDAYDAALLFCALARAAGIPAIPSAGIIVGGNNLSILHWWAEFYLEGFGWVPVDPALEQGIPFESGASDKTDKKDCCFGYLDAAHIVFSRGIQHQNPMLPDGKTVGNIRSYAFRNIWEEATAGITGYSSLWRLPKVTAVY